MTLEKKIAQKLSNNMSDSYSFNGQDELAQSLLKRLRISHKEVCCAESLTGGLLGDAFVRIPGASDTYEGTVNTYAIRQKTQLLGVDSAWLEAHGAVNAYTAEHMALGALELFDCDGIALSTTGVAGPGPDGSIPAGTVFVGVALSDGRVASLECRFDGDRESVRRQSVYAALEFAAQFV